MNSLRISAPPWWPLREGRDGKCEGRIEKCEFLARKSVSSSPIVRIFGKGKCKFIANFSSTMVTSLPSISLSVSLSLSPKVPHAQYRKRFRASYNIHELLTRVWSHQLTSDLRDVYSFGLCLQWSCLNCLKTVSVPTFVLGGLRGSTVTSALVRCMCVCVCVCVIVVTKRGLADVGWWVAVCFLARISLHMHRPKVMSARMTQSQAISQSFSRFHHFQIDDRYEQVLLFFTFRNSFIQNYLFLYRGD